ncbi:hypothetical protein AB1Y20_016900 [Prymnesium parvum]|uniref:Tryptophan synthase beta chain-like PALP domain-containing protein n=1 Tax=Prymnesium parvum TaxID=97485 RepID=A0AB34I9W1_PRYPA
MGLASMLAAASTWPVRHLPNLRVAPPSVAYPSTLPLQLAGCERARSRIASWAEYEPSALLAAPRLAARLGVRELWLKDETRRLGVGSFKPLGGAYAVDTLASRGGSAFSTASAGNHGVGLAWGCRRARAACHVFVHGGVPERQAEKMRALGATVHRVEGDYEASVEACKEMSAAAGWQVVQDVSWEGYEQIPEAIYSGYQVIAAEMVDQWAAEGAQPPTHVFVNAGVGGLAAAVCSHLWARYGERRPRFVCVEPDAADCLMLSAKKGAMAACPPSDATTVQVGLDCRAPASLAWRVLEVGANDFVAIGDEVVQPCIDELASLPTPLKAGESAVAGLGVIIAAAAQPELAKGLQIGPNSRLAAIICEGRVK